MAPIAPRLRKAHKWMGFIFGVTLALSAASGVLHSVMSRTQSPPPKPKPAARIDADRIGVSIPEAARRLESQKKTFDMVSVRSIGGEAWYQFYSKGGEKPEYVNAADGRPDDEADERYAAQIAQDHLGRPLGGPARFLTAFDDEYIAIFRILPVYRFDSGDKAGTRVYVSTLTGSVTRETNDRKQFEANVFSNVHKFAFIKNKDLRDLALVSVTVGGIVAIVLGYSLLVSTRRRTR